MHRFLFDLALILITTKLLGMITKRFNMTQVVGALFAGIVLGPAVLGILEESTFIANLSELGVIVIMFIAGLGVDIKELKKSSIKAFLVALMGMIVPLLLGTLLGEMFFPGMHLQNVMIGVALSVTSVGITVETLKELGKLETPVGSIILSAALIDDILGLCLLSTVMGFADSTISIESVIIRIILFLLFAMGMAFLLHLLFKKFTAYYKNDKRRWVVISFALCLLLSYIAETYFGVADIIGAFVAGVAMTHIRETDHIKKRCEGLSYLLLSPVFFANIGLKVEFQSFTSSMLLFTVIFIIISIISKTLGGFIGAKFSKIRNIEALRIGVGMVAKGEVILIAVEKAMNVGILKSDFYGPVIFMVICSAFSAPILLKWLYKTKEKDVAIE